MNKFFLLLVSLFFLETGRVCAQIGYAVTHYSSENGLPQNSIKSIMSDAEGFIWLGTEDGLVRFDGRRFTVFNSSNLKLNTNRVAGIRLSTKFVKEGYQQERAKVAYAAFGKFSSKYSAKIEDGRVTVDTLYASNRDCKIVSSGIGTIKMDDVTLVANIPDILSNSQSGNDHHIIATGTGDGDFFSVSQTHVRYFEGWKKKYECKSPGSNLWSYFTIGNQLYYREALKTFAQVVNGKVSKFTLGSVFHEGLVSKKFKRKEKLYWNGNSQQAFLATGNDLFILEQKAGQLSSRLLLENCDVLEKEVDVIYFDSTSEKIFLGSVVNGLYVLTKTQFTCLLSSGEATDNVFYAQTPISANSVVTPTGVVLGKKAISGTIITDRVKALKRVNSDDKRVLLKISDGSLLIKSKENLFRIDRHGNPPAKVCKFDHEIKALCESQEGNVWIGVIEKGLYRLKRSDSEQIPHFISNDSLKEITYLETRSMQEILIGTSSGLFVFNTQTQKSRHVKYTEGLYIKSIHPEKNGQVWLAVQGKGLMLWDGNNQVVNFPLDRKGYLGSSHCIVDDGLGYLWIPTNRGLFQFSKKDLLLYASNAEGNLDKSAELKQYATPPKEPYYSYHTLDEGFLTNEFNGSCQPCAANLTNGYISLPSLKGLVWFLPKAIQNYAPQGQIILDKVVFDGREVSFEKGILHCPYNADDIELSFATAYFGNRDNLGISYAIVPKGQTITYSDWIPLNNDELKIHLSGSRSGNYDLYIGKIGGFGNHFVSTHLLLEFPQKWYGNGWIIFLLFASILGVFTLLTEAINRYRLRAEVAKNAKLAEIIAVRTEELSRTLAGLEISERDKAEQLYLLSRLVASISHDVQSPLKFMSFVLRKIPDLVETNDTESILTTSVLASNMSDRMSTMLEQLIDFSKMQVYGKKIKFETIDLHKLVQDKIELFWGIIKLNNSTFHNAIPREKRVNADYRLLSIIIHNLLDNAAKYTVDGEIWVYVERTDDFTKELVIANTGNNIPTELVAMINSSFNEGTIKELVDSGALKGLGLLIVKEVAALANISVTVTQTGYTRFHLSLPRAEAKI